MTTVSNQNSLNPLARTKGGCATTNTAGRTSNRNNTADASSPKEDDYDGMMPLMGIREDEEIASVEADGAGANDTAGGGTSNSGSVEKKILTAALVTSMADAGARSGHTHDVTPTTSEASSFSSVESTDSSMNQSSGSAAPAGGGGVAPSNGAVTSNSTVTAAANSRTIYPRASKAAATTKVTTALTCKKPSPKAKRRLDVKQEPSPPSKSMYHPPPSSGPVPNPLAMMDITKMPPPQPQVTFQYMQYPQAVAKPPPNPVAVTSAEVTAPNNIQDPIPIKQQPDNNNNSFSAVAESMSTQQYQTDNLMSSSTNELMSSQSSSQNNTQGRGRIFSIDLDPAVLDFVESVVDPLQETVGRTRNYSVTFADDDVNSNSGRSSFRRDRGFSFEFFSLGIDSEEPLPPPSPDEDGERGWNHRVRGDSIIFDPVSFREGGIHETSALMHVEHESRDQVVGDSSVVPAVAAAPQVQHVQVPPSIIHNPPMRPPAVPGAKSSSSKHPAAKASSRQAKASGSTTKPRSKAKSQNLHVPQPQGNSNYRQITITTTSSSRNFPQSFSDNTIHMPHGSDAAAAAAAGMTQPSPPTSSDGYSGISHTSCPMELLNKGGRIGIYLPEERKARIAKFHDKRKQRMWRKKIKYDCRKKLADSRPRIKGRFVKRSDVDEV